MLANSPAIIITIVDAKGSTPRGIGAEMIVTKTQQSGTIGGGALEWEAIAHARALLDKTAQDANKTIALGPRINQCCGGQVTLNFAFDRSRTAVHSSPNKICPIYIFGAGHTGAAIAQQFLLLDMDMNIIDERHDWLEALPKSDNIVRHQEIMPESIIASAPAQSIFIITTHSHDLDFAITVAALARKDAAYVGMIGSKTKRERFRRWAKGNGIVLSDDLLNCPMGEKIAGRKEPKIVALSVAHQIMGIIAVQTQEIPNG